MAPEELQDCSMHAAAPAMLEALDHVVGGYEDLVYLVAKGIDLDKYDHPLHQERKDSRIDEAITEARAAIAQAQQEAR